MDGWKDGRKDGWTADWWLTTSEVSLWVGTVLDPVVTLEKMILVVKVRPPGDCVHPGLLSSWGTVSRGLLCPEPPCCPPPPPAPKKAHPSCLAVVCPCCLSLPAAGSAVILASAALPLPSCSWPRNWLLPSPGQRPWPPSLQESSPGRRCTEVSGARAHTSSSVCCQQPWAAGTLASATGV